MSSTKKMNKDKIKKFQDFRTRFDTLNGWEQGQTMLLFILGTIQEDKYNTISDALLRMCEWHDKQHNKNEKCELCDTLEQHFATYNIIKLYRDQFLEMNKNKKNQNHLH
jgi:hypothetical protein